MSTNETNSVLSNLFSFLLFSGDIVCDHCSQGRVIISEFPESGPVRACNHCCFGQDEVSVKKEEHIMDILRQAEKYAQAQKDQFEYEASETAGWQADYAELEARARQKAAEFSAMAAECASLKASMISSSGRSFPSQPLNSNSQVLVFQQDPDAADSAATSMNHEFNVLCDLELIEKNALQEVNKYMSEADAAAEMQRKLSAKVRDLDSQVQLCNVALSTTGVLEEEASKSNRLATDTNVESEQDSNISVGSSSNKTKQ